MSIGNKITLINEIYDTELRAIKEDVGEIETALDSFATKAEGIPSISSDELDTFTDGVCRVKGDTYFDGKDFNKYTSITIESENYALCIAYCEYETDNWTYLQTLIFGNGVTYTRHKNDYCFYDNETEELKYVYGGWSLWKPVKPYEAYRADAAIQDSKSNVITDTYATKEELVDKHTWKLLGDATVTEANVTDAGEDGVTSIAIDCGDLSGYDELRINLQCGVNSANAELSNANHRHFTVGILNDVSEVIGQNDMLLVFNQGSANGTLNHTYINNIIINSYFSGGILQYSEIFNNNCSSHCYRTTPSVALPSLSYKLIGTAAHAKYGHPIDLKNGNHIVVFQASSGGFKFPAGTELKVYGR